MNIKRFLVHVVTVFSVTLIVSAIVTLLWNLFVDGASTVDWETSFRSAIVFAIILPWIGMRRCKGGVQSCGVGTGSPQT
jgi:hypothetical protein